MKLVLIEDMAQTGMADMARNEMKKEFAPGERPLLLDETGKITKYFGIPRDRTQLLVYDKTSRLRHVETAARIKLIAERLASE